MGPWDAAGQGGFSHFFNVADVRVATFLTGIQGHWDFRPKTLHLRAVITNPTLSAPSPFGDLALAAAGRGFLSESEQATGSSNP